MGYCSFHQAIPEESELYHLLETDPAAALVLEAFWHHGSYPLDLRECADEVEDILGKIAAGDETELAAVQTAFDRLEVSIERTCAANLGLKARTAFVEKVHAPIRQWVKLRWASLGREDGPQFAEQLLFGNARLGPFAKLDSAFVRRAADFFREPGILWLSEVEAVGFGDDLRGLADLCITADECREVILMSGE